MILSLAANETQKSNTAQVAAGCAGRRGGKKGVDELSELLHNLTSLLLMNTTLHRSAAR
jgi:hypothetical protein